MKKIILLVTIILLYSILQAQNVGISATGTLPDASAMLDVKSSSKGVLFPRVALTGTTDVTTIPSAATSLLVYNTATVSDVSPGYYYWDGTLWERVTTSNNTGINISTTAPITGGTITSTGAIGISQANTTTNGYLSSTDWNTFNNKVGGSGVSTRVAFWATSSTLSSNANLYWNNTNSRLGIGLLSPSQQLHTTGIARFDGGIQVDGFTVIDDGAGWHRSYGVTGWYNGTYGGGWYMADGTWIRNYGAKPLYINSGIRTWFNTASIRITDGTQAAGKVLTSDAVGNASWQNNPIPKGGWGGNCRQTTSGCLVFAAPATCSGAYCSCPVGYTKVNYNKIATSNYYMCLKN